VKVATTVIELSMLEAMQLVQKFRVRYWLL
jgi:hypothetical protein